MCPPPATTLEPDHDPDDHRRIVGYRAEHSVTVVVRDLDRAGEVLDAAATSSGDDVRVSGLAFDIVGQERSSPPLPAASPGRTPCPAPTSSPDHAGLTLGPAADIDEAVADRRPAAPDGDGGDGDALPDRRRRPDRHRHHHRHVRRRRLRSAWPPPPNSPVATATTFLSAIFAVAWVLASFVRPEADYVVLPILTAAAFPVSYRLASGPVSPSFAAVAAVAGWISTVFVALVMDLAGALRRALAVPGPRGGRPGDGVGRSRRRRRRGGGDDHTGSLTGAARRRARSHRMNPANPATITTATVEKVVG